MFLMIGVFWGVTQSAQKPVLTAPFPFPKKVSDQIAEDVGSSIAPSIMKSQYGIGVRQAVSILKKSVFNKYMTSLKFIQNFHLTLYLNQNDTYANT